MFDSVAIIPNSRPAYIASPVTDEDGSILEISLDPIVAWRVDYQKKDDSMNVAIPITTDSILPGDYAIYFSDTKEWSVPEHCAGEGLQKLREHFEEERERKKDFAF